MIARWLDQAIRTDLAHRSLHPNFDVGVLFRREPIDPPDDFGAHTETLGSNFDSCNELVVLSFFKKDHSNSSQAVVGIQDTLLQLGLSRIHDSNVLVMGREFFELCDG